MSGGSSRSPVDATRNIAGTLWPRRVCENRSHAQRWVTSWSQCRVSRAKGRGSVQRKTSLRWPGPNDAEPAAERAEPVAPARGRRPARRPSHVVHVAPEPAAAGEPVGIHRLDGIPEANVREQAREVDAGVDGELERAPEPAVDLHEVRLRPSSASTLYSTMATPDHPKRSRSARLRSSSAGSMGSLWRSTLTPPAGRLLPQPAVGEAGQPGAPRGGARRRPRPAPRWPPGSGSGTRRPDTLPAPPGAPPRSVPSARPPWPAVPVRRGVDGAAGLEDEREVQADVPTLFRRAHLHLPRHPDPQLRRPPAARGPCRRWPGRWRGPGTEWRRRSGRAPAAARGSTAPRSGSPAPLPPPPPAPRPRSRAPRACSAGSGTRSSRWLWRDAPASERPLALMTMQRYPARPSERTDRERRPLLAVGRPAPPASLPHPLARSTRPRQRQSRRHVDPGDRRRVRRRKPLRPPRISRTPSKPASSAAAATSGVPSP